MNLAIRKTAASQKMQQFSFTRILLLFHAGCLVKEVRDDIKANT